MTCTPTCHDPTRTQAHCGACHRTLGSVTDFDRHRRGGVCLDPVTLGLVEVAGLWASPERHASAARKAVALKARLRVRHTAPDGSERVGGSPGSKRAENPDLAPIKAVIGSEAAFLEAIRLAP